MYNQIRSPVAQSGAAQLSLHRQRMGKHSDSTEYGQRSIFFLTFVFPLTVNMQDESPHFHVVC